MLISPIMVSYRGEGGALDSSLTSVSSPPLPPIHVCQNSIHKITPLGLCIRVMWVLDKKKAPPLPNEMGNPQGLPLLEIPIWLPGSSFFCFFYLLFFYVIFFKNPLIPLSVEQSSMKQLFYWEQRVIESERSEHTVVTSLIFVYIYTYII